MRGFLPKTTSAETLASVVRTVHDGGRHVDPELAAEAIARAQAEGRIVAGVRPNEVYTLIIALAGTWSPISATCTASPEEDAAEHERRRACCAKPCAARWRPPGG